ncbi:MAG: hypothetical protein R3E09_10995 [Novosphingobium sp.]|nr:hypothetical protein [Novosphingobium sp.]
MKRFPVLAALALAALPLSGCADGHYRYGMGVGWVSHPYNVWYDGYYGPFYDGYWGTDGFFYFRLHDRDNHYRRGDDGHFRRGDARPAPRYRPYEGRTHEPPRGTRMPNYPSRDGRGDRR